MSGHLVYNVGDRNSVQKVMYIGVIAITVLTMLSGLSIWKPVQFQELMAVFGGFDAARRPFILHGAIDGAPPPDDRGVHLCQPGVPRKFGYPMKIRIPTKLGFKNPKFVVALSVTDDYPGGFWEDYGYNWFSGS